MTSKPLDYNNRAALAVNIATNWQQFYPTYSVNFTTLSNFTTKAQDFHTKVQQNNNQTINKKDNSALLQSVNKEIKTSATRLKEYIRDAYDDNIEAMYAAYGLETVGKSKNFPADNDRLERCLTILIAKLQEPNNPIANRKQGLVYWQDLATRHANEWSSSKSMKAQKAQLVQECRDLHMEIGDFLSKLFRQIAIDFPSNQVASVRRTFGFLKETYK